MILANIARFFSYFFLYLFIYLFIYLFYFPGITSFLDSTCFSASPRIDIDGDDNMLIGGYNSGDDTSASVSFERVFNTGTGSDLPTASQVRSHPSLPNSATQLLMPQSGGKERIGVFKCIATKGGQTEEITTIIMADNSKSFKIFWSNMYSCVSGTV